MIDTFVNEFKWSIEEAQEDIARMWKQIGRRVSRIIIKRLKMEKDEIIFLDEIDGFVPDWHYPEDWKVITLIKMVYNSRGSYIEHERLDFMAGRLCVSRTGMDLEPSFRFTLDKKESRLYVDIKLIRKIMQDSKDKEDRGAWTQLGPELFNEAIKGISDSIVSSKDHKDLRLAFKTLGFDKDEVNIMTHNVLTHESLKEGMDLGELVRLGLDNREEKG